MKILFITANRLGDAVLANGVLASLIDRYPDAKITIACGPYAAGLFRAVPGLEQLITLHKKSWNRHWLGLWRACIGARWDIVVDMRNSIVSRMLMAGKIYRKGKATGQHKVIENAAVLGVTPPPTPRIWIDPTAHNKAAQVLNGADQFLALAPAANWPPKQWQLEKFAQLTQRLTTAGAVLAGAKIIVIADERERAEVEPLIASLPRGQGILVTGQDLLTVAAILKKARLFVGNDSGLMHLSAAVGTLTLGLFGPGYEHIYGPWGDHCAVQRTPESREELLARMPDLSKREPNLMGGLMVETVEQAARRLLEKTWGCRS